MVGCAVEHDIVMRGMAQPACQLGTVGHEEGGVKQAGGVAGRFARIPVGRQRQQRQAGDAKNFAACGPFEHRQAEHLLIETGDRG
ncbi:hypothetical protein D3C87_1983820 [compost metagenome]